GSFEQTAQGELIVKHLQLTGEVAIASTYLQGQDYILSEIRALKENLERLFKEIKEQKEHIQ
ncbi:hypothetical protein C0J52_11791, partial [Blattella germanica]